MSRPTIKDVARESGYSITTVSLVLNNKDVSIPESTRAAIWEVVRRLGYRPNQLAVGMITRKTNIVGLIIPDNSNSFFADISKFIEIAAEKRGYNVIYGNSANSPQKDLTYMEAFADRQVDGIIYTKSSPDSMEDDHRVLDFISNNSVPMVTIDRVLTNSEVSAVVLDQFQGGYLAAKHLIELGHRRIGCYTGPSNLENSQERLEGYRYALAEAGIPFVKEYIFEGNFQIGPEEEAFDCLIRQNVTAVFAFNDIMALGLYRIAQKRRFEIPKDLSIIGFDDIWAGLVVQPALTTVRQPIAQMAECAVETLVRQINGKRPSEKKYMFEPQLVTRGSTARITTKE
mgnify:CR=1 FL=1